MTFRKLFPAVLIDVPNSKVCLIEGWSIEVDVFEHKSNSFHQTYDKYNSSPTKLLTRTDLVETVKCLQQNLPHNRLDLHILPHPLLEFDLLLQSKNSENYVSSAHNLRAE